MTKIAALHAPAVAFVLPEKDEALYQRMLEAYNTRRAGSLRHKQKSVARDIAVIKDMTRFTKKAPWYWNEADFEKWCAEIGLKRRLAVASQRHYQGAIRGFIGFLVDRIPFKNEVRREYGIEIVQICTSDNCIPHVDEREISTERPDFTHKQIGIFFDAITAGIEEAAKFASKDFNPLRRDKALFSTIYYAGLRASESLGLNIGSFEPNPEIPEFGDFGYANVWGKGTRGSGPRHGAVPTTVVELPQILGWYIKEVRPHFMRNADPNETALFLSERGNRLSLSGLEARFTHCIKLANLEGLGLVPHSLRHSSVTQESMRFSSEMVRRKHRHRYAATTQGYMHVPDEFVRDEITRAVRENLDLATKEKAK